MFIVLVSGTIVLVATLHSVLNVIKYLSLKLCESSVQCIYISHCKWNFMKNCYNNHNFKMGGLVSQRKASVR